jgi:hypothetical protein
VTRLASEVHQFSRDNVAAGRSGVQTVATTEASDGGGASGSWHGGGGRRRDNVAAGRSGVETAATRSKLVQMGSYKISF